MGGTTPGRESVLEGFDIRLSDCRAIFGGPVRAAMARFVLLVDDGRILNKIEVFAE